MNCVIVASVGLSIMRNLMFLYMISDGAGLVVFCLILLLIAQTSYTSDTQRLTWFCVLKNFGQINVNTEKPKN